MEQDQQQKEELSQQENNRTMLLFLKTVEISMQDQDVSSTNHMTKSEKAIARRAW